MVIAHHLIWTGYGWWLPNDPRGSGSREIRRDVLRELGEIHYGRKRVQPPGAVVREFYDRTHPLLMHEPHRFTRAEIEILSAAFADALRRYTCYACALMPDHVHLVLRKHRDPAEVMIERIQGETRPPIASELELDGDHPVWTRGGWKVFLETPDDIERTIRYVERNPLEIDWPSQRWSFVTAYDGWPFHQRGR